MPSEAISPQLTSQPTNFWRLCGRQRESTLKVLHLVVPAEAGGLERVVESLAIGHHRAGHDVTVGAFMLGGQTRHPFVETLRAAGVSVEVMHSSMRGYLRERRLARELCLKLRPDVVHTHGYRIDVVHRSMAAGLRIPSVTTVHGHDVERSWKARLYQRLQRRNYRRFDAVVAVSTPLYRQTLADGVPEEKLYCVPNAWGNTSTPLSRADARRALGLHDGATVIGWVGRLSSVKGPDVLLDALSVMPDPKPTAVVIGYGPEEAELRAQARRLGIDGAVKWFKSVTDASRLFPAFDTFVVSSRSEGTPIVILEAMAAQVPIVATSVGGLPDMISEEQGWLVPSEDAETLAQVISESLSDRVTAKQRASAALERLSRDFAVEPWLEAYETVYKSIGAKD